MGGGAFKGFSISHFAIVATLAMALLFPNLNRGGLSGYDDALYAHEGKEMLRGGDWWTVHFNGSPNFEYPPAFLWLEATSMKAFGVNDTAAKLPSALAGLGAIVVLYLIAAELTGDFWMATLAMFILTTTQLFVKYATHAMTDVPFTFFIALALYLYLRGLQQEWWFIAAGFPIAIAILTRSVTGVFPLGVMAAHLILKKRYQTLFSLPFAAMCAIALGLPLVWFGFPPRPEHMAFVAGKVGDGLSLHVLDYLWILLRFYWPWMPFFIVGVVIELRSRELFPLIWTVCLVLPLSLASTKYARYLIPAFPAFAITAATGVDRFIPIARRAGVFWSACGVLLGVAAFTALFPAKERGIDMRTLAPIAERNTSPAERILLYTSGEKGFAIQNQLLWYSDRYTRLVTDPRALQNGTAIIDKPSFEKLGRTHAQILAESDKFVCVRLDQE